MRTLREIVIPAHQPAREEVCTLGPVYGITPVVTLHDALGAAYDPANGVWRVLTIQYDERPQ